MRRPWVVLTQASQDRPDAMCLIAWRTAPASAWPLVLAANRDEFHGRATEALHRWPTRPSLLAGRDLVAGGTWLGVDRQAGRIRVAMLTNVRDGRGAPVPADAPSRGLLVTDVLAATTTAAAALQALADRPDLARMAGFNLVAIDLVFSDGPAISTSYLAHRGPARPLAPVLLINDGGHGLSNGRLDEPWPKTRALRQAVVAAAEVLDADASQDSEGTRDSTGTRDWTGKNGTERAEVALLEQLVDQTKAADVDLPDTGIDRDRERWLSSAFLVDERYGTRCSTVLTIDRRGRISFLERRYNAAGASLGDRREAG